MLELGFNLSSPHLNGWLKFGVVIPPPLSVQEQILRKDRRKVSCQNCEEQQKLTRRMRLLELLLEIGGLKVRRLRCYFWTVHLCGEVYDAQHKAPVS
jgi:hypothetical protein